MSNQLYVFWLTFDQYMFKHGKRNCETKSTTTRKANILLCLFRTRSLKTNILLRKTHSQKLLYYSFTGVLTLSALSRRHVEGKRVIRMEEKTAKAYKCMFLFFSHRCTLL